MNYIKEYYYLYLYTVFITVSCCIEPSSQSVHGRYTQDIEDYELTLPHRVTSSGEFLSFSLPQSFTHKYERWKRDVVEPEEKLYYNIIFNERDHHVELWPNHGFVSPDLVTEVYRGDAPVSSRKLERHGGRLCHYVGCLKGDRRYPVALSLCDGLAGYVTTPAGQYFIEPMAQHQANARGQHLHVVHQRKAGAAPKRGGGGAPSCGTRERWADAWEHQLKRTLKRAPEAPAPSGAMSLHRYLEILVVVDQKFIEFHRNDDMETYILTIMNMVSNYYHDASTGNQIDVHVVRVIYLEQPDSHLDLEVSSNASRTLDSFCTWAKSVNPPDVSNPQHHDIAVLLTRYDLCSNNGSNCNLMGLAFMAAACDPDRACAINEDNGLALGITVTHEVGHVMGCGHDNGEDSPCKPQNQAGDYYIMSPFVHMQTTEWSPCSKKFMTQLFENRLGECLNDEPQESLYKDNDMLPGSVYGADYQCNLAFPGSVHCVPDESMICKVLFCKAPGATVCNSKGEPPSDGTKCGENMWCYRGACVEMGQRPAAVDGGWSAWSAWGPCSRTCGGGVAVSERTCTCPAPAHKGRHCLGERKRVQLCATQPCPSTTPSFRQHQCTAFDYKPFRDNLHTWKEYFVPDKPCELNCINEEHVYVALAPRAVDGTSCKPGTKYKCIFGVCRKIGCDWVIDSSAVEDACGICNGDGTDCKVVEQLYTAVGTGYTAITTIPAGSLNIRVFEKAASENTIAVSAENGKMYLNGNFTEEANGAKDFGGVPGIYDHPAVDRETLFIRGPLPKPIILMAVFYNRNNSGIEYKYSVPVNNTGKSESHHYVWEFVEYGECSKRCGPGIKTAEAICAERTGGKVSDKYCNNLPKPEPKVMECSLRECKTEWRPRNWGPCDSCDGKPSTRYRSVDCVQESAEDGKDTIIVKNALCKDKVNKYATYEMCCSYKPCQPNVSKTVSTDAACEFQREVAGLWRQVHAINARRRRRRQHKNEIKNKIQKKKFLSNAEASVRRNGIKRESNNFKKYLIVPKNLLEHEIPYHKYRRMANKGNQDMKCESTSMSTKGTTTTTTKATTTAKASSGAPGLSPEAKQEKFISDHVAPQGTRVIEVPIKMDHERVKLTDAAFEADGDKVIDTLDFCSAKIYNGKEADKELKKLNVKTI